MFQTVRLRETLREQFLVFVRLKCNTVVYHWTAFFVIRVVIQTLLLEQYEQLKELLEADRRFVQTPLLSIFDFSDAFTIVNAHIKDMKYDVIDVRETRLGECSVMPWNFVMKKS